MLEYACTDLGLSAISNKIVRIFKRIANLAYIIETSLHFTEYSYMESHINIMYNLHKSLNDTKHKQHDSEPSESSLGSINVVLAVTILLPRLH